MDSLKLFVFIVFYCFLFHRLFPFSGFSYRQKMGPLGTLPNIFGTLHVGIYRCKLSKNKETQDGYVPWSNLKTRL